MMEYNDDVVNMGLKFAVFLSSDNRRTAIKLLLDYCL